MNEMELKLQVLADVVMDEEALKNALKSMSRRELEALSYAIDQELVTRVNEMILSKPYTETI